MYKLECVKWLTLLCSEAVLRSSGLAPYIIHQSSSCNTACLVIRGKKPCCTPANCHTQTSHRHTPSITVVGNHLESRIPYHAAQISISLVARHLSIQLKLWNCLREKEGLFSTIRQKYTTEQWQQKNTKCRVVRTWHKAHLSWSPRISSIVTASAVAVYFVSVSLYSGVTVQMVCDSTWIPNTLVVATQIANTFKISAKPHYFHWLQSNKFTHVGSAAHSAGGTVKDVRAKLGKTRSTFTAMDELL